MRYFTLITKHPRCKRIAQGRILLIRQTFHAFLTIMRQGEVCGKATFCMSPKIDIRLSVLPFLRLISMALAIGNLAAFAYAQQAKPRFKVIAIAEKGGIHKPFVDAAKVWLSHEALVEGFSVDYIENTDQIDDVFLSQYKVFIQLNFPPYAWTPTAMAASDATVEAARRWLPSTRMVRTAKRGLCMT